MTSFLARARAAQDRAADRRALTEKMAGIRATRDAEYDANRKLAEQIAADRDEEQRVANLASSHVRLDAIRNDPDQAFGAVADLIDRLAGRVKQLEARAAALTDEAASPSIGIMTDSTRTRRARAAVRASS